MEDKYVKWFKKSVYDIQESIIVQKTWLEKATNLKAERLILGKNVYGILNDGLDLENDKNNKLFDLPIAIDCNDDWLIAVCQGCQTNAQNLLEDIEVDE